MCYTIAACFPFEPLEKCTTFEDIFPGLSRTKVIFQDFPGPGIFKKKNPGLSRRRGNRVNATTSDHGHLPADRTPTTNNTA